MIDPYDVWLDTLIVLSPCNGADLDPLDAINDPEPDPVEHAADFPNDLEFYAWLTSGDARRRAEREEAFCD